MAQNKHVVIYTDGACSGNPGPGGFGIILQYGEHRKEISKGFPNTTNNRMELLGVITALEAHEELAEGNVGEHSRQLLEQLDILVDGPFVLEQKDLGLRFRGSANQRIIDVPQSLKAGKVCLWQG